MLRRSPFTLVVVLLLAAVAAPVAMAWTSNGVQVNTGLFGGTVGEVKTLPDGSGGLFILWTEMRFGSMNVYLQRINSSGTSQWNPINTGIVCQAAGEQSHLSMASDNAGGVLITWEDQRVGGGQVDVYAHRFGANGIAASGWPSNGLLVASSAVRPQIVAGRPTEPGHTWLFYHRTLSNDIQGVHISYVDNAAPALSYPGPILIAGVDPANPVQAVPDNLGGAVLVWGIPGGIELQRFDAYGQPAFWNDHDFLGNPQFLGAGSISQIAYDGEFVFIASTTFSEETGEDVHLFRYDWHHFITAGSPPIFSADGPGDQHGPQILAGPSADVLMAWHDEQNIRAVRTSLGKTCASSDPDPWIPVTVQVTDTSGSYSDLSITHDGNGGAFLAWAGGGDIFSRRVRGNMTLGSLQTLCNASGTQSSPVVKFAAPGSVLTAWIDGRAAAPKIYAQQTVFDPYEGLPAEVCSNGVDDDCDGYGGAQDPECCSMVELSYGQCEYCDGGSGIVVCADLAHPWSPPVFKQLCCP